MITIKSSKHFILNFRQLFFIFLYFLIEMENRFIWLIIFSLSSFFVYFSIFLFTPSNSNIFIYPSLLLPCCHFSLPFVKSETLFDSFFSLSYSSSIYHPWPHYIFFGKVIYHCFYVAAYQMKLDWKFKLSFVEWMLWMTEYIRLLKAAILFLQ